MRTSLFMIVAVLTASPVFAQIVHDPYGRQPQQYGGVVGTGVSQASHQAYPQRQTYPAHPNSSVGGHVHRADYHGNAQGKGLLQQVGFAKTDPGCSSCQSHAVAAPTCEAPASECCAPDCCPPQESCNSGKICLPNPLCIVPKIAAKLERAHDSFCYALEAALTCDPCEPCSSCDVYEPICPKESCGKKGCKQKCNDPWAGYHAGPAYGSVEYQPYQAPVHAAPKSPFGDDVNQPAQIPPPRRAPMTNGNGNGNVPALDPQPGNGRESLPTDDLEEVPGFQPPANLESRLFAPPALEPQFQRSAQMPSGLQGPTRSVIRQTNHIR